MVFHIVMKMGPGAKDSNRLGIRDDQGTDDYVESKVTQLIPAAVIESDESAVWGA
jgi:hypothetical protein